MVQTTVLLAAIAFGHVPHPLRAQDSAVIHYHRPDSAYDGWGLHVQGDVVSETRWEEPLLPTGDDEFGVYWEVPLQPGARVLTFVIHQGEVKDPGMEIALDLTVAREAWVVTHTPQLFTEPVDPAEIVTGMEESTEPALPPPLQTSSASSGALIGAPESATASLFMRSGAWKMLWLDAAGLVVLGRKYEDGMGIVAFNLRPITQTATLDVNGFAPVGSVWVDPLSNDASSAIGASILAFDITPLGFRIWLTADNR
jgi:hypothetical protein